MNVPGIELLMGGSEDVDNSGKVSLGSMKLLNNRDLKKIKYLRKKQEIERILNAKH